MSEWSWNAVDTYINDRVVGDDPVLDGALRRAADAGVPQIEVAPNQGKLLHLLARMSGARRILELGTLAGYSTIWLARALPAGGRLVTLEVDEVHAAVARANLEAAGLAERVDVLVGPALETLPSLAGGDPFDFVFIDADKRSTGDYLEWALRLARPGTVIVADNVIRHGAVADPSTGDPSVEGVRRFFDRLHEAGGVTATAVQTVGSKGWDGFALALVEDGAGAGGPA
ncbi:MAG TPA: O-methyltransferase [Baekduia sp.]